MKKDKPKARYGSGSLKQRGRIWHVRFREVRRRPDGTTEYVQHRESTRSEDKGFAERFLNRRLQEVGGRRARAVDPRKVSYEDLRENFLARCADKGLRSLKWRGGKPTLDTLSRLDRFFGGYRASEVALEDLRRFRKETVEDGASDARVNRCMATLRTMFNQARKDDLLTRTEMPPHFPMVKESAKARDEAFIEPEHYAPLRRRLKEPLRSAFTLAYHSAVRVHEMKRLRWRDFDFKRREVFLPEEVTKTGESRVVPLPADFDLRPGEPDDLPLAGIGERRETAWNEVCVRVGAGWFECRECGARCRVRDCPTHGRRAVRGVRYHGPSLRNTRHTAVRSMNEAGMERTRIKAISGHKTDSMFERYNIGREKDVAEARAAIERFHRLEQRRVRRGRGR